MLGGRQVTRFKRDGEQYDVMVQVAPLRPRDAGRHPRHLRARRGRTRWCSSSNLVDVREGVAPQSLNHFNRLRAVKVTATLAPGYSIDEALKAMDDAAKDVLPPTAQTDLDGQSREFRASGAEIYFTFVLALAFIYLVLSAQFESFVDPFVIMLSVPLSMTGALLALWLTGGTLNIYSQVGLVTLVGLITKHGILIVEFSNQLRAKGEELVEAVVDGGDAAAAADPDDHRRDGAGRAAAGACPRRRRRIAHADRLGDRRRDVLRHAAHAVRRPDRLHAARAAGARRGPRAGGASPRRGAAESGAGRLSPACEKAASLT